MAEITLSCQCGRVHGRVRVVEPKQFNRVICHCHTCQQFAHYLEQEEVMLDAAGGTDIIQMYPSNIAIDMGHEHIRCVHVSPKGVNRWYAGCCKTPIGATGGPGLPYFGLNHRFIPHSETRTETFGPVTQRIHIIAATGKIPADTPASKSISSGLLLQTIWRLLKWKVTGKTKPNPFFSDNGEPVAMPEKAY